jgi:hypothetical protein
MPEDKALLYKLTCWPRKDLGYLEHRRKLLDNSKAERLREFSLFILWLQGN